MQLNRYLAHCGLCSRRKATEIIQSGEITVNHFPITDPAYELQDKDTVRYEKKVVKLEDKMYVLLNKPKGYVTTVSDPFHEKTVLELLKGTIKNRVYPVGRLDMETTGLLLLTNDGDLAEHLAHPRHEIKKSYHVVVDRPLQEKDLAIIKRGVYLRDGKAEVDRIYFIKGRSKFSVGIELHSGKNRIIRRIFSQIGFTVTRLDRVTYAGLTKQGLKPGDYRLLKKTEVDKLKQLHKES
jgi:23S rRNA pseudouridine2605 synthase